MSEILVMKILYLSHCVGRNGSTIALVNIITEMKRFGHEVGVIIPEKDCYLYPELNNIGVTIFCDKHYPMIMCYPDFNTNIYRKVRRSIRILKNVLDFKRAQKYVYGIVKQYKPDIVHTNTSAVDYAYQACKKLGIPHVWHIRELLDTWSGYNIYPSKKSFVNKLYSPNNHNIAITQAVFDGLKLRNIDRVIYDGVIDTEKQISSDNVGLGYPFFLSVGYCTSVKGYLQLIEQFAVFSKSESSTHLVIAGWFSEEAPYFLECKTLIEKYGIGNRVHFIGVRNDVYTLMKNSIALIVASPFEGFGFTMVEAMYNNTLVIGRNTSGTKEQFNKGLQETGKEIGLRFNKDEEIPALMKRAMDEDFSEMKNAAKSVVLNNYTAKINARAIEDYYSSILDRS